MGAYENPQTVIDTSGQIWANAILAVTNNAAKRAEEERKKLLEENKLFAAKLEKIANNGLNEKRLIKQSAINNNVLNQQEMEEISRVMDQKTRLQQEELSASGQDKAILRKQIDDLDTQLMSYVTFKKTNLDATNAYLKDNLDGDSNNYGRQGYASIALDNQYAVAKMIDSGYLEGKKIAIYDSVRGWGYKYSETDERETIADSEGGDGTFTVFNDEDKNFQPTNIPKLDEYYTGLLEQKGIMVNGKIAQNYLTDEGSRIEQNPNGIQSLFLNADLAKIAQAVNGDLDIQLGVAGGGSAYSNREKISIWKDIFLQTDELRFDGVGGAMNAEDKIKFDKFFKERIGDFIPELDVIIGEDNILSFQKANPDLDLGNTSYSVSSSDGTTTNGKLTPVQINETAEKAVTSILDNIESDTNNYVTNQSGEKVKMKTISGSRFLIYSGYKQIVDGKEVDLVIEPRNIDTEDGLRKAFYEIFNSDNFKTNVVGTKSGDDEIRKEMDKIFQIKLQKLTEDRKKKKKEEFDYTDFTDGDLVISNSDNGSYNDYIAASQPNPKYKNIIVWSRAGKPGSDEK